MNNLPYRLPDGWRLPDLLGAVEEERDRLREDNYQLRLALEFITRECNGPDRGPAAVALARTALKASASRSYP